jgi:hypothetical protein
VSILSLFAIPHDSGNASLKVAPFKSLLGGALYPLFDRNMYKNGSGVPQD